MNNLFRKLQRPVFIALMTISILVAAANIASCAPEKEYSAYLFAYFTGNGPGQEQIHFAISEDGFNYKALNNNKPIIDSKDISTSGGVRDPHILRCADGKTFYMVVTDLYVPKMGWRNYAMVMLKSTDLINWTSSAVNIPETYPQKFGKVSRVWAPQTIYDEKTGKYMVYFSMKQGDDPDKIYYAYANEHFTGFEAAPKQLYFPPAESNTKACIDGDIIYKDGRYYLFHKAEDGDPGIKLAISDKLTEGYKLHSDRRIDRSRDRVEGSCIFKLNNSDDWILMYDVYTRGRYQFTRSSDLLHFEVIDNEITMDFHPRHGTVVPITNKELMRLVNKWGTLENLSFKATSESVKTRNVAIDREKGTIRLSVKRGTDLTRLDPKFEASAGANITPKGKQDFSKGPVEYSIDIAEQKPIVLKVTATEDHNPVLDGYYADPDIIYSEKTAKYYIYPTSDGFTSWSGTYFKAFSSDNLVDWKDQGVILDLKKDVSWADRNAWAPCITEKKIDGQYKYFYYFTAAQKIGVAVSDSPTGPFTDSGKPLIDSFPPGVNGGQQIDPDVFTDPKTNKSYLYWGNGYMAVAELNDDMVSINQSTIRVITPDRTFREGAHVFYRNGKYYILWSEDDTRSENYRVRYAIAPTPTGPLDIPADNLVIAKDAKAGIYATGHNSTIQVPGEDEWYIVYHRFTYPKGIRMGRSAGYHRETCIDKLTFDESGKIIRVQPTLEGIAPIICTMPMEKDMAAYLMVYFSDSDHSLHMALSSDGYTFTALNDNNPIIEGHKIAMQKGIRDPHITRGPDGAFYMAMTDLHIFAQRAGYRDTQWERDAAKYDWGNNRGFVLMKSFDLINWTHSNVLLTEAFSELKEMGCAWAPQTIYDPEADKMMLYFTMRIAHGRTKLYYAYTDNDFTKLTTLPKLLFEYPNPEIQVLDADITPLPDGRYCMMYVAQGRPGGIKLAFSDHINKGYEYQSQWIDVEPGACEAPNVFKRIGKDKWVLMYDIFSIRPHNFGFCQTSDFVTFEDLGHFNEGVMKTTNFSSPKHGAVIQLTKDQADRLANHWDLKKY
ncbi:MAG: family 43 glycosylhydrolase [Sedimentisphaerales bacterium]|nr:family 43 glycosylhydrolase [Sedimentisphaerales bacterium]